MYTPESVEFIMYYRMSEKNITCYSNFDVNMNHMLLCVCILCVYVFCVL